MITTTLFHHLKLLLGTPKQGFIALIGLYFLLVMHYFQHNVGGSGLDIPINPLGWIIVSGLVGLGLVQIIQQRQFIYNKYLIIIAVCCTSLLIPLVYSNEAGVFSYARFLGIFAGVGILAAVYQMKFSDNDRHKILWLMLGGIFLESLFALTQFYILPHISALNINIARPSAIFFQANVAATFFATGIFIALYLLKTLSEKQNKLRVCLVPIIFTCALSVMLLQSRTAFLGTLIGTIVWIIVNKKISKLWLTSVVAAIAVALISFSMMEKTLRDNNVYTDAGARVEIYSDSFATFTQKPLLGHGYGTFGRAFREYQANAYETTKSHQQIYRLSHPHNEILLWAVEGGVASLIPLFIIMLTSAHLFRNKSALLLFPLVFPISLHIFSEFPFYHSVASYLTFLLLLAVISDKNNKSKSLKFNSPRLIYGLVSIGIMFNAFLMLTLMQGQSTLTDAVRNQDIRALVESDFVLMSENVALAQNETLLHLAIEHDIPIGATSFNDWITPRIKSYPRTRYYQNMLLSYSYLNEKKAWQETLEEAKRLFPTLDWSTSFDNKKITKPISSTLKTSN